MDVTLSNAPTNTLNFFYGSSSVSLSLGNSIRCEQSNLVSKSYLVNMAVSGEVLLHPSGGCRVRPSPPKPELVKLAGCAD